MICRIGKLKKFRNPAREWGLNPGPSDIESDTLTIRATRLLDGRDPKTSFKPSCF